MMQDRHGGELLRLAVRAGCREDEIIDFSASINPLGPPESLRGLVSRNLERLAVYPDSDCVSLRRVLGELHGIDPQEIVIGNGSTELIHALPLAVQAERAVIPVPSYGDYRRACRLAGLPVREIYLSEERNFRLDWQELTRGVAGGELIFLGRPNNPTGIGFELAELCGAVQANPAATFVVDESFIEFTGRPGIVGRLSLPNLIVIRSLTKFYAIPGLRLGYAVLPRGLAERLRERVLPWSVNVLAQRLGREFVRDQAYGELTRDYVGDRRRELLGRLAKISGLRVWPGEANFLMVRLAESGLTVAGLEERLLSGVGGCPPLAIRVCDNFPGLERGFFRLAVRRRAENEMLCAALSAIIDPAVTRTPARRRPTPALMLQGTASNAGKSVLAAAFCRIFLEDGVRVAPFKAQNMSLNSFVTRDGGEMGRAQVVQAQACRLDPDVRMNPVLLKPSSQTGCQVIVNGAAVGNFSVEGYINYKPQAWQAVVGAYESLASEVDLMVLEGAGSPAEVNLRGHDIVNMAMARRAGARVLLAGDIDRGGVFASFIGTLEVMAEWERQLVAGFLVNRFRGEAALLGDAYEYVRRFTGKAVLGCVPYLRELGIPEEDSVGFKAGLYERPQPAGEFISIGVVDLPHISNFTDFEPFLAEPDVHLSVIRNVDELAGVGEKLAALILPGSKNVIHDLAWLRDSGLAREIIELASLGETEIIGICGGFQILGRSIEDPLGLESSGTSVAGLSILELVTSLAEDKVLKRREGHHLVSGLAVHGYEIHHGRTVSKLPEALRLNGGEGDGARDGRIWGSYLHGIFDDDLFRRWFIDHLRQVRQLSPLGAVVAPCDLEPALDRLAEVVRQSVDLDEIYRVLGL